MKPRWRYALALVGLGPLFGAFSGCGPADFDPENLITGVRVLATRLDKPYAKPGDQVNLELLAVDGRAGYGDQDAGPRLPMRVFWLPVPCVNPTADLYYACFGQAAGAAGATDAAASQGPGADVPPALPLGAVGTDLTPFLREGTTFQASVPSDIITAHPPVAGTAEPYGLMILFNIACAGHVEVVAPANGPQAVPLGCVNDQHQPVAATDFVIGFTRIYVYENQTNANPQINAINVASGSLPLPADPAHPLATDGLNVNACGDGCTAQSFTVDVPPESQELTGVLDENGNPARESVWVDFYTTAGHLDHDARLLYDSLRGRITDGNDNAYTPPGEATSGHLFVVVHDDRNGTDWRDVPLHVK